MASSARCTSSARTRPSRRPIDPLDRLLEGLDHLVVQDMFLTRTAEMAHVVLPASASWCESEGTVTSSERRVQRVRKALEPPARRKDDVEILCALAERLGPDWGRPTAEQVWEELRSYPRAPGHELRAPRAARRDPMALPGREPPR
jgi:formate dehydrogenase major subunit